VPAGISRNLSHPTRASEVGGVVQRSGIALGGGANFEKADGEQKAEGGEIRIGENQTTPGYTLKGIIEYTGVE